MDRLARPDYPRNMRYLASRLVGYHRGHFRLEAQTAQSVGANRKIVVNLPENSIIDLSSFAWHITKASTNFTTGPAPNNQKTVGLLVAAPDFITSCNVYVNGVQCSQNLAEYNTANRLMRVSEISPVKQYTIDKAIQGFEYSCCNTASPTAANITAGECKSLVCANWLGLVGGESSVRFLDTSLCGAVRVEITTAPNEVLATVSTTNANPSLAAFAYETITGTATTSGIKYTLDQYHFSIDCMQLEDGLYGFMLRQKIEENGWLPVNFTSYNDIVNNIGDTNQSNTRWNVSSQSINKFHATMRDAKYNQFADPTTNIVAGIQTLPTAMFNEQVWVPNYFYFRGYASFPALATGSDYMENVPGAEPDAGGTWKYQFSLNNVAHPNTITGFTEGLYETFLNGERIQNDVCCGSLVNSGSKPGSVYNTGYFSNTARFNQPADHDSNLSCAMISGFDSRGTNSNCQYRNEGLGAGAKSCYVLTESTATLRIGAGKTVAVVW